MVYERIKSKIKHIVHNHFCKQLVNKKYGIKSNFEGVKEYWENNYLKGGTSGLGSYGKKAKSKAAILNHFVQKEQIKTVIEYGCGDGNQLELANYPEYIGLDISPAAINFCQQRFLRDSSKKFFIYNPRQHGCDHEELKADLVLSLDVIYHIIEEDLYHLYLRHLFRSATRFVIIFSADVNGDYDGGHVLFRKFSAWIEQYMTEWDLVQIISPENQLDSFYPFYIYRKKSPAIKM